MIEDNITKDLYILQSAENKRVFDLAFELLKIKYKDEIGNKEQVRLFFEYLEKEWYEGASIHAPSTNNALESFNNVIKSSYTLRDRFSFSVFLGKLDTMLSNWSLDREKKQAFPREAANITRILERSGRVYSF